MADIKSDKSEVLHYDNPDFPIMIRKNYIPANCCFDDISLAWHDDLEFIYVLTGRIRYMLDGKIVKISAGEGIFVNSRNLHVIMNEDVDCVLLCIIFPPSLLCSSPYVTNHFIKPIIEADNIDYILLSNENPWQAEILKGLEEIYELSTTEGNELKIMTVLHGLWETLYENVEIQKSYKERSDESLVIFKRAIEYVQAHYGDKITLQDLCNQTGVGKNRCTAIFNRYTNMSPIEYVRYYRIEKSFEYLRNTDMTITEIAFAVGFTGASYYTETFRQHVGYAPMEVRQRIGPP